VTSKGIVHQAIWYPPRSLAALQEFADGFEKHLRFEIIGQIVKAAVITRPAGPSGQLSRQTAPIWELFGKSTN
jgi:hypothetical protein